MFEADACGTSLYVFVGKGGVGLLDIQDGAVWLGERVVCCS